MAALGLSAEEIAAVDKMADYKARNGDAFEALIKQKQQGNPKFAFLFDIASPAHAYYQQRYHQLKTQQQAAAVAAAAASATAQVQASMPPHTGGFATPPTLGGPSQFQASGMIGQPMAPSTQPPSVQMHPMAHMQQMQMAHMQQMQMMQAQQVQQAQLPLMPMQPLEPMNAHAPSASPEELARERAAALAQRLQQQQQQSAQLAGHTAAVGQLPSGICTPPPGAPLPTPLPPPMHPGLAGSQLPPHLGALQPICTPPIGFNAVQPTFGGPTPPPAAPAMLSAHSIPVGALATLLNDRERRRGGDTHKFEPLQPSELPHNLPNREPPSPEVLKAVDEFYKGGRPPRRSRQRRRERRSPSPRSGKDQRSDGTRYGGYDRPPYERTGALLAQEDMGVRDDGSAIGSSCGSHVGLGGHSKSASLTDQFAEFRGRRSNDYKESMAISKANQYNNWYNV